MTTVDIEIRNGNLRAFKEFFSGIVDAKVERNDDGVTVTVDAEPGNARHVKYVAGKYGCDAKQVRK